MRYKPLLYLVFIVILVLGIFASLKLAGQRQELRKKASESIQSSKLSLIGPNQVQAGEKFSVNLILDNTGDPDYTISNVDAVVSVNSEGMSPTCIPKPCPVYDLPPNFCQGGEIIYSQPSDPCDCSPPPKCIMRYDDSRPSPTSKPELTFEESQDNIPRSMPPVYRTEPITLLSVSPGKIFDNYIYPGSSIGQNCGGIAGLQCPDGYFCSYGGASRTRFPDEMGTCYPYDYPPLPIVGNGGSGSTASSLSTISLAETLVCTQEVMQCPDGSWVGRTGPRCEFAPCWVEPVEVTPIPNPPNYGENQFKISGAKTFSVDENGYFKGYTGNGIFATLNFEARYPGKVEITLLGSQALGYRKDQPAKSQSPQERLLTAPQSLIIEVLGEPKPTCIPRPPCLDATSGPRCLMPEPLEGWCPQVTPTPTCTPVPTDCFDKEPNCMSLPYIPPGGWCSREKTFTGTLERLNGSGNLADIRQWGEFQITIGNIGQSLLRETIGQNDQVVRSVSYPVSVERAGDSKSVMQLRERMNQHVGQTVKLTGILENLNVEGGFWGIWAKEVEPVACIPKPDCSIMIDNPDGSKISICDVMGAPSPGTIYCQPTPTPSAQCAGKPDGTFCGIGCEYTPTCSPGGPCYACDPIPGYCQNQICVPGLISITPKPNCPRKILGDGNCDDKIDGVDYSLWLNSQCYPGVNQKCADTRADFNNNGKIDDDDYTIWSSNRGN